MNAKKTAAQQDVLAPVEAAVNASKETVEAVMKAGTDAYAKQYEQTVTLTKDHVEKTSTMLFQNYDELVSLNKANLDAVVATTTTFAKGFETLAKELMGFAQGNVETGMTTTKKVLGAKNLQEMMDLQSEYSRALFDSCVAESAKVAELSMKTANEAFAPLQERAQVTVEKIMKPAA
jgi:phasin family protein